MKLWIYDCKGATTADIERGTKAAEAVFEAHAYTAEECHRQHLANIDDGEGDYPGAAIWMLAENEALKACCKGWAVIPESAHMAPA